MFLGTFSDNFENFEVFPFFKVFSKPRPSKVHWRLFFETKLPQNRFRTCLDNIRDSFGHFRNIEILHFFQSFPYSTLHGALCKIFTEKITSKHVQNMFDCFWERFLGILKNWSFFQFFGVFPSFDSPGCTGQFFPKKSPQNKFKTCLDTFRKVFGHFRIFKFFRFFFEFFQVSTLEGALVNLFLPKKLPQSMFKTCLNFLGNVFGQFEKKWKFFHFSDVFPCFDPPGCTGQYFFPEKFLKTSSTLVWKLLRTFLDTFRNSNFFDFFRISASFDLQGALVKKSSKKISSKQIWTLLEMFFGILKKWDFFLFFEFFSTSRPSRMQWPKFFTGKKTSRHVENMFEHFWERIWAFWKNESFPVFWSFSQFGPSRLHWRLFFEEKLPQNRFGKCLDIIRDSFGHFRNIEIFHFFQSFPYSTPRVHCAKFLPKKLPRNMFKTCLIAFGNVFWAFWKIEGFSSFLEFF